MRESGREESRGRLQVSNSVYIPPVKATEDCSVILTGGLASESLIGSLYLPGHFMYTNLSLAQEHKGSYKKPAVMLISRPPLLCVCPIHCHIITLCMIILLNLTRIKHASHMEHIYMLM